jgi:hypothetical protein
MANNHPFSYITLENNAADTNVDGGRSSIKYVYDTLESLKRQMLSDKTIDQQIHPSWIVMPDCNEILIAMQDVDTQLKALESMIVYMIHPIIEKLDNGKQYHEWFNDLKEFNFHLMELLLYYQGEDIAVKFNNKYKVNFNASDALYYYRQVKEEGYGRLAACNEMHLSFFNNYEVVGHDDWSCFTSDSYMELIGKPRTEYSVTDSKSYKDDNFPKFITTTSDTMKECD